MRRISTAIPDSDSFHVPDAIVRIVGGEAPSAADCLFLQETVLEPEATRLLPASADTLAPYQDDTEYLADHFEWVNRMIELRELQASARRSSEAPSESQTRALAGQVKQLRRRCEVRMPATRSAGVALPRLERLVEDRHLTPDERLVVLVLQADLERGAQLQIRSRRAQAGLKI